ncbi:MAG: 2-hydroxyacid dehydrogenase [Afipia sp.]
MSKGALALLISGGTDNWAPDRWKLRFSQKLKDRDIALLPTDRANPDLVHYAAVWKPEPGLLRTFPNLKAIFNLGAGVDAVLQDPLLPTVPLVRVADDDLTSRMTEYIVMHTLMHHRQQAYLADCQARRVWAPRLQWPARAVRVGLLGMGVLGRDAAIALRDIGFQVAGWSKSARSIEGIQCYSGPGQLNAFLARTDILVVLLPLTSETRGFLARDLFMKLASDGPLGGPVVINAGRGGLQSEKDIIACLEDGTLKAVTLDVFEREPLPSDSPLWTHPAVTISPHNAADTDPDSIASYVTTQILNFEAGQPLQNVVDRQRGY